MITKHENKRFQFLGPPFGGEARNTFTPKYKYFVVQQFFDVNLSDSQQKTPYYKNVPFL
jgi:hypothetical protein